MERVYFVKCPNGHVEARSYAQMVELFGKEGEFASGCLLSITDISCDGCEGCSLARERTARLNSEADLDLDEYAREEREEEEEEQEEDEQNATAH